jgi:CRISPR/Cas system-associated protein Cas5 (RAMP superfamily)
MMKDGNKQWLVLEYEPVSLFSLRMSVSTSSGAKTLLVPTPFTVKMALVNSGFKLGGLELAEEIFDLLVNREICFNPPKDAVINHTFIRIKREPKEKSLNVPFNSTIAYREFCFFKGTLKIAIDVSSLEKKQQDLILSSAYRINYFGKRGSFFQFINYKMVEKELIGYTVSEVSTITSLESYGVSQFLDDLTQEPIKELWEKVNIYSSKTLTLGKERVLIPTLIPYKQKASTRNYTYFTNSGSNQ